MTFAKALSDLRETLLEAISDLKASVSNKQDLAGEVSGLKSQLAAANAALAEEQAKSVALGEKLTETEEALTAERAALEASKAEVESIKAGAKSAEHKAAAIVASIGVPPVKSGDPEGTAEEKPNKVALAAAIASAKRAGNHSEAKRLAAQFKKHFR